MTNIVSAFSNSTFQWYLVGFFESSDFYSFRATCKTFTKVGRDDKDLSHKGIAFTDYIRRVKQLDLKLGIKYYTRLDKRNALNDLDFHSDAEIRKINFVKTVTYTLPELSFVTEEPLFHSKISQEDFIRYAHHASFANLEIFHYALPKPKIIGKKRVAGGRNIPIFESYYIKPSDVRRLAKKCQNIHTLHVHVKSRDPTDLTNFLLPIDPKSEGDSKASAKTYFPNLTYIALDCNEQNYSKKLISILNELPSLKTVKVYSGHECFKHFFELFSEVPKFTEFCARNYNAENLSKLTSIQKLSVVGCFYSLEDFEKIFSLPSLTSLTIGNLSLEPRGISSAQFMEIIYRKGTQIRELFFLCWQMDTLKDVFPICSKMENLTKIKVEQAYLSDEDLFDLSQCNLKEIQLGKLCKRWGLPPASDKGLLALKRKSLQKLTLGENPFSNQAILEMISGCPNLTSLDISDLSQQIKDEVIKAFGSKINVVTLKK